MVSEQKKKKIVASLDFETNGISANPANPADGQFPISVAITLFDNGQEIGDFYCFIKQPESAL